MTVPAAPTLLFRLFLFLVDADDEDGINGDLLELGVWVECKIAGGSGVFSRNINLDERRQISSIGGA